MDMRIDPLTRVVEGKTELRMLPEFAEPVVAGNLVPGLTEVTAFYLSGSDWLPQLGAEAMRHAPQFSSLGVKPQFMEYGVELDNPDKAKALADPESQVSRILQAATAVKHAEPKAVEEAYELVREGMDLLSKVAPRKEAKKDAGPDEYVQTVSEAELEEFRRRAAKQLAGGACDDFAHLLNAEESPQILLKDLEQISPLFNVAVEKNEHETIKVKEAIVAATPAVLLAAGARVDTVAKSICNIWKPVLPSYVTLASYALNNPRARSMLCIHVPPGTPPAMQARHIIEEVAERKMRCCDIILLNPLRSPAELTTHWSPHFANEPAVQAMVWATVKYRNLDHLRELARGVELVSGSAAGHFVVVAGRGKLFDYDTPVHAALAGRSAFKDSLLDPDGGRYGVLDSTFGPHEDLSIPHNFSRPLSFCEAPA